jgi:hypothetical protein
MIAPRGMWRDSLSWVGNGDGLSLALDRLAEKQGGREASGYRVQFTDLLEKAPKEPAGIIEVQCGRNPRQIPSGCAKNGHGGVWCVIPAGKQRLNGARTAATS